MLLPDGSAVAVLGTSAIRCCALIWHQLESGAANTLQAGMEVQGCLDWELRHRHMRMHYRIC